MPFRCSEAAYGKYFEVPFRRACRITSCGSENLIRMDLNHELVLLRPVQRSSAIRLFLVIQVLFLFMGIVAVTSMDRFVLHRAMHPIHGERLDLFFRYFTHVGDGLMVVLVALIVLAFGDRRSFLMVALASISSAMVTQFLKQVPFAAEDRPFMFLEALGDLHWVEGLEVHHHNTFPSGHATATFSLFFSLVVLNGRPKPAVAFALVAVIVAYSRVYLNQHFTFDIMVGSMIGTGAGLLTYWFLYLSKFATKPWLNKGTKWLRKIGPDPL